MARYKTISMPVAQLEALLLLLDRLLAGDLSRLHHAEVGAIERLALAKIGKDRRAHNQHNVWPKQPQGLASAPVPAATPDGERIWEILVEICDVDAEGFLLSANKMDILAAARAAGPAPEL